jgi:hypothetical protein
MAMATKDNVTNLRPSRMYKSKTGVTDAAVTGLNLGDLGSAEVVRIDAIQIDPDYQRDLRHDLVAKIASEYDIVKAGAILVGDREDESGLWAIDGQHRMIGAQQAGETEIFAHVVHGTTKEYEAELRLARNDRRSDSFFEKFRTRLVMGDEKAHAMVEVVRQNGTHINTSPSSYHGINSIATLELLYDIDEKGVWLGRVLRLIREAWGEGTDEDTGEVAGMNPDTCSTSMLKAACWFIGQHIDSKEVSWTEFVERLQTFDVQDIRRKAVSHKAANGGALWINYYRALVELWNFRRQDKRKITWKTIGSINQLGAAGTRRETFVGGSGDRR